MFSITSWKSVLLEKPAVAYLVNKFLAFYGKCRFIAMFLILRKDRLTVSLSYPCVCHAPNWGVLITIGTNISPIKTTFVLLHFLPQVIWWSCEFVRWERN